jgi:hypothetical protein
MKKVLLAAAILCLASMSVQAQATVTSPNGGESWALGSSHDITWTHSGDNIPVRIQLYRNGEWAGMIASGLDLTADRCPWTVGRLEDGTSVAAGGNFKIRIIRDVGRTLLDDSNTGFTITASEPASITVTSPNGGESWELGSSHPITWSSRNVTGTVSIFLLFGDNSPLGVIGNADVAAGTYPWTVGDISGAERGTVRSDYRIHIQHSMGSPNDNSNSDFAIIAAEPGSSQGHDFVISDPFLESRNGSKGFRVKVTDLESDFNGWVVVSHYCMGMGLGNAVNDRRRLELRRGVPATVNLSNVRGSLFDGKCDVTFRFDVNPDHAVTESHYDNNTTQKKFCWESGHDGRFVSLRVGRNYTSTCEECSVVIRPADVESVNGETVRVRLEIMVQNCGNTAIRGAKVRTNYSWRFRDDHNNIQEGATGVDLVEDIDIDPGNFRLLNRTVTLRRYVGSALNIYLECGESGALNANNRFTCHPNFIGF